MGALVQYLALVRKNLLLKRVERWQTLLEIAIPVGFMLLLRWIKSVSTVIDQPNVAYACGQAFPWYYEDKLNPFDPFGSPLLQCLQKPDICSAENYYRESVGGEGDEKIYTQYGYMSPGYRYPFYALSVGDDAEVYADFGRAIDVDLFNPSLDLATLARRLYYHGARAVIAVAPAMATTGTTAVAATAAAAATTAVATAVAMVEGTAPAAAAAVAVGCFSDRPDAGGAGSSTRVEWSAAEEAAERFAAWLSGKVAAAAPGLAAVVRRFESETAVNAYIANSHYDEEGYGYGKIGLAVIFNDAPPLNRSSSYGFPGGSSSADTGQWDYSLRLNHSGAFEAVAGPQATCLYPGCAAAAPLPGTRSVTEPLVRPPSSDFLFGYANSGFLTMQKAVDEFILSTAAGRPVAVNASLALFPERAYRTDQFQEVIASTLGIFYILSFLYPVSRAIRALVTEKESGVREALIMAGASPTAYAASWLTVLLGQFLVVDALIVAAVGSSVFAHSDKGLLFLWLAAASAAIVAFCALIAALFWRARTAATLGPIIFFAAFFPYFAVSSSGGGGAGAGGGTRGAAVKALASLLAPTCFALGGDTVAAFEGGLVGVQTFNSRESISGNLRYDAAIALLLLDAVLYVVLGLYLERVVPSEHGARLPWYFPFQPKYWLGSRSRGGKNSGAGRSNRGDGGGESLGGDSAVGASSNGAGGRSWWRQLQAVNAGRAKAGADVEDEELQQPLLASPGHGGDGGGGGGDASPSTVRQDGDVTHVGRRRRVDGGGGGEAEEAFSAPVVEEGGPELRRQLRDGRAVSVRGLRKVFGNGTVAVAGLDLDLFEGQITVLLGHNGAGKSTTISMLTGLLPPTAGGVTVRGCDLRGDLPGLRRRLGVCPQHDVLLPQLTVFQHLRLWATIKGPGRRRRHERQDESRRGGGGGNSDRNDGSNGGGGGGGGSEGGRRTCDNDAPATTAVAAAVTIATEVGLAAKLHCRAGSLSGGQKRKLCLAMAFVGDSEFVVLDEPTSGVDPFARRSTWKILERQKKGRVILLTTHTTSHAERIGSRIAIMADGRLRCCGSALFLKSLYGVGYTLTVMQQPQSAPVAGCISVPGGGAVGPATAGQAGVAEAEGIDNDGGNNGAERKSGQELKKELHDLIMQHAPEAQLISSAGAERSYRLPFDAARSFPALFRELDSRRTVLGVETYGVGVTTLEEVFLRVASRGTGGGAGGGAGSGGYGSGGAGSDAGGNGTGSHGGEYAESGFSRGGKGEGGGRSAEEKKKEDGAAVAGMPSFEVDSAAEAATCAGVNGAGASRKDSTAAAPVALPEWRSATSARRYRHLGGGRDGGRAGEGSEFGRHLGALMNKRLLYVRRDKQAMCFQIVIPALLFFLGLILLRYAEPDFTQPPLELSAYDHYNPRLPPTQRNAVPFQVLPAAATGRPSVVGVAVMARFDGVSVEGTAVDIDGAVGGGGFDGGDGGGVFGGGGGGGVGGGGGCGGHFGGVDAFDSAGGFEEAGGGFALPGVASAAAIRAGPLLGNATDVFAGCARGAAPLLAMSEFLLRDDASLAVPQSSMAATTDAGCGRGYGGAGAGSSGGKTGGGSRYGAVTLDGLTDESRLVYGLLVNASAVHGAAVFTNLIHSAYLQVLTADAATADADAFAAAHDVAGNRGSIGGSVGGSVRNESGCGEDSQSGGDGSARAAIAATAEPPPRIIVRSAPLPKTARERQAKAAADAFTVALMAVIALCFLPASYAIFVVREREVKAKHQQIISGVSLAAYWTATFLWDAASYLVPFSVCLSLIHAFGVVGFTAGAGGAAAALLLLLYGPAVAAFTYCLSFLFSSHTAAQNAILLLNFITGLALMVTSFVLALIDRTRATNAWLKGLYRLFPGFCLGDGLAQLVLCQDGKCPVMTKDGFDLSRTQGPFAWEVAGADIAFLVGESFVYFGLCLAIEYVLSDRRCAAVLARLGGRLLPGGSRGSGGDDRGDDSDDDDEDVAAEERRIMGSGGGGDGGGGVGGAFEDDIVRLERLRKVYGTPQGRLVAVHDLSFGVRRGECFGFLGTNGAGKSTTLATLTGEILPTSGRALVAGFDVVTEQRRIRRRVGYCPQFDALLDLLTAEEHLRLYAHIKGIPAAAIDAAVAAKLTELDLTDYCRVTAGMLSGGNRRKLSVAVATMGSPRIVFLDEPSTGMDPVARRLMWAVISRMVAGPSAADSAVAAAVASKADGAECGEGEDGCSVVLTTHNMEEAAALANRIGIMVNGRLRCLGSAQHLKKRFGRGYEIDIKLRQPSESEQSAIASVLWQQAGGRLLMGPSGSRAAEAEGDEEREDGGLRLRVPFEAAVDALVAAEGGGSSGGGGSGGGGSGGSGSHGGNSGAALEAKAAIRRMALAGGGSGAFLGEEAAAEGGSVPLRLFCEWWCAEDAAAALDSFLHDGFFGCTRLVERQSLYSFRYQVAAAAASTAWQDTEASVGSGPSTEAAAAALSLAEVFGRFEAARERLKLEEYSVGQVTLEQIFNHFAAMQRAPAVGTADAGGGGSGGRP